jgi:hypothetical protein
VATLDNHAVSESDMGGEEDLIKLALGLQSGSETGGEAPNG